MTAMTFSTARLSTGSAPRLRLSADGSAPRLRLTTRGRAVFGGLIVVPLVAIAIFFGIGAGGAQATGDLSTTTFDYVSVEPGQSLWQLAEQLAPQSDPSEVVADILALNHLSSGDVQPGQNLAVPAEYSR